MQNQGLPFQNWILSEYFKILDTILVDEKARCRATSFYLEPGLDFSWFYSHLRQFGN